MQPLACSAVLASSTSVKPANAAESFAVEHVNGALIGGASLKAEDYLGIAAAA